MSNICNVINIIHNGQDLAKYVILLYRYNLFYWSMYLIFNKKLMANNVQNK